MLRRALVLILMLALAGCGMTAPVSAPSSTPAGPPRVLRLATTTSTADSGLLDAILPDFEQQYGAKVEVVAVGTGQAIKLGEDGNADVVLVHARQREDAFVAAGFGVNRRDVMYNDFIIVGPAEDPARITGIGKAADAFKAIATEGATFDARGDDSGTATKELGIWAGIGMTPTAMLGWYKSLGQGMGETLITANEQRAYTLSDRATYLAMRDKLPNLTILVGDTTAVLEQAGLAHLASHPAQTLSGGERQRVALARALVLDPHALLLDEPTANLDPYNVAAIERMIAEHHRRYGTTIIIVTHNLFQARRLAQRAALLLDGRIVEIADVATFFESPGDARTAAFVRGEMIY